MTDPRGNFGILSASCFTGSMVGQPPLVFAVMCYAVANARPYEDDELGLVGTLEINPTLLAMIFSVQREDVEDALRTLCSPDPNSRSTSAEGRRLIHQGAFRYHLVNMAKYRSAEGREAMRERWREDKRKWREKLSEDSHGQHQDSPHVPLTHSSGTEGPSLKKKNEKFEEWWEYWPPGSKKGKHDARKAWASLTNDERDAALADIPERSRLWKEHGVDMAFVKQPPAFLRGRRWEDPLPTASDGDRRSQGLTGARAADASGTAEGIPEEDLIDYYEGRGKYRYVQP